MKIDRKTYRFWGAWLGLLAICLLAAPRALVHTHHSEHTEHHAGELPHAEVDHADCPVCDMDHASALDVFATVHLPVWGALAPFTEQLPLVPCTPEPGQTCLRGPPAA